jgi:hypothetical protein
LLNMMYLRRFIWPAAAPAVPLGGSRYDGGPLALVANQFAGLDCDVANFLAGAQNLSAIRPALAPASRPGAAPTTPKR